MHVFFAVWFIIVPVLFTSQGLLGSRFYKEASPRLKHNSPNNNSYVIPANLDISDADNSDAMNVDAGQILKGKVNFEISKNIFENVIHNWNQILGANKYRISLTINLFNQDAPFGSASNPIYFEQYTNDAHHSINLRPGKHDVDFSIKISPYALGKYRLAAFIQAIPIQSNNLLVGNLKRIFLDYKEQGSFQGILQVKNLKSPDIFAPLRTNEFVAQISSSNPSPKETYYPGDLLTIVFPGVDHNTKVCSDLTKGQGYCDGKFEYWFVVPTGKGMYDYVIYEGRASVKRSNRSSGMYRNPEYYDVEIPITNDMPQGEAKLALVVSDIAGNTNVLWDDIRFKIGKK